MVDKKRLTIMLDVNTISRIKNLYKWYTPKTINKMLGELLNNFSLKWDSIQTTTDDRDWKF